VRRLLRGLCVAVWWCVAVMKGVCAYPHPGSSGWSGQLVQNADPEVQQWLSRQAVCVQRWCDESGCTCQNENRNQEEFGSTCWVALICTSWTDKCDRLEKTVSSVARAMAGVVKVLKVNPDRNNELMVAKNLNIRSYPAVVGFPRGLDSPPVHFSGQRTAGKISTWVLGLLPSLVTQVHTMDDMLAIKPLLREGLPVVTVILFSDKQKTPASFKSIALEYSRVLRFAEVRMVRTLPASRAGVVGGEAANVYANWGKQLQSLLNAADLRRWPTLVALAPQSVINGMPGWTNLPPTWGMDRTDSESVQAWAVGGKLVAATQSKTPSPREMRAFVTTIADSITKKTSPPRSAQLRSKAVRHSEFVRCVEAFVQCTQHDSMVFV
jgi:hypothetical protein